ncbi:hypothetical protein ACFQ7N_10055 [Streptomyces niveus]|uniref:hypothetical protein n=1 Tax=Streptomyces niveus TaxID=193462 RepID=UPI003681E76F
MTVSVAGLLSGAMVALGVALAVRALLPRRAPLAQVMRRTHHPERAPGPAGRSPSGAAGASAGVVWAERIGSRLLESRSVASRLPARDLELLEMSPASLVGRVALYGLLGLLLPQWFVLLLALGGTSLPFALPLAAAVAGGVFFALKSLEDVRARARRAREEYRYYTVSLLERVALARASDAGAAEALARAAASGDGRAAVRIHDTLEHARLSGVSAWVALRQLGEDLGVPELAKPAASMTLAGEERAAVYAALEQQANALSHALVAEQKAAANEDTEKMTLPGLAVAFLMIVFLAAPPLTKIMAF